MKAIHDIKHHCQRGQNLLICLTNSMKIKILFRPSTIINFFAAISVCLDLGCPWNSNGYTKETQVGFLPLSVQGKYPSSSQEVVTTSMTFLYIGMKDDSFKWKTRWQSSKKVSHSSSHLPVGLTIEKGLLSLRHQEHSISRCESTFFIWS